MFNTLANLPKALYNIVSYLAESKLPEAENLWKLLKYNEYDALSKPNLTVSEKLDLMWKTGKQEDYNVFLTGLIEDEIQVSKCILKIYQYQVSPESLYNATVLYAFDFLHGGQMALVDYNGIPCSRDDIFVNSILTVLNGAEIGGIGKFMFAEELTRYSGGKWVIGNSKTFEGYCLYMGTNMATIGEDYCG